jgi:predicted transcriptional regulator of viral defense system
MKRLEILKRIRNLPYPVFTIADAVRLIPEKRTNIHVYLNRMKKDGLIYEIERGKYTVVTDPVQIATSLIQPSYISFLSGMSLRGMTDQITTKLQVVATRQKNEIQFQGMKIQFIRFKRSRVFGFEKIKRGRFDVFLAEPEKLIIDSLYMPKHTPVSEVFKALQDSKLDESRLLEYAKRMDSKVTSKRLGYLLDLLGSDYSKELAISRKLEVLNPSKRRKGEVDKKWKLIINEVLENA